MFHGKAKLTPAADDEERRRGGGATERSGGGRRSSPGALRGDGRGREGGERVEDDEEMLHL